MSLAILGRDSYAVGLEGSFVLSEMGDEEGLAERLDGAGDCSPDVKATSDDQSHSV